MVGFLVLILLAVALFSLVGWAMTILNHPCSPTCRREAGWLLTAAANFAAAAALAIGVAP